MLSQSGYVAGFGPGAMVMTTDGELPVEWLESGDRVITRDHGAQPILWIERWKGADPAGGQLPDPLRLMPTRHIARHALTEPLRLAPQTRVMVRSADVELHFGEDEMLAEVADLARAEDDGQCKDSPVVNYHHLILARHSLIWACGIWVESAGPEMAARLSVPSDVRRRSEIFDQGAACARPCLARSEARMIRQLLSHDQSVMALLAA